MLFRSNTAQVQVANDPAYQTNEIENPVPSDPTKVETDPYQGTGVTEVEELGAVKPGDVVAYKISYRNYKTKAGDVVITDALDDNVAFVSASDNGAEADGTVTWTIPAVPAGTEGSVNLTVSVKDTATVVGKIANRASVNVDNDGDYDTNIQENPVPEDPEKTEASPYAGKGELGGVKRGQEITYEIKYKNYRSQDADVTITDELDEKVEYVSSSNDGSEENGIVTWTIPTAANTEGTITLTVRVKEDAAEGTIVKNKAVVKVGNDAPYNTQEITNPLPEPPHKRETAPDQGTGLLKGVNAGDELRYEISYKNYKSEAATVTITDPLDENVEFVSASDNGAEANGAVTWSIPAVPAGDEGKVTLTVKVKEDVKGVLVNNQASVAVGNDTTYDTETVTNPTTTDPVKAEPTPGADKAVKVAKRWPTRSAIGTIVRKRRLSSSRINWTKMSSLLRRTAAAAMTRPPTPSPGRCPMYPNRGRTAAPGRSPSRSEF